MYQSPQDPRGYERLSDAQRKERRRSRQALALELILVVVAMLFLLLAVVSVLKQKQSDERFYYQRVGLIAQEAHPDPINVGVNANGYTSSTINFSRR